MEKRPKDNSGLRPSCVTENPKPATTPHDESQAVPMSGQHT
jgi:hypothetical protein